MQGLRYLLFIFIMMQTGCSPVNSLQPFDQHQAAVLIGEHIKHKTRSPQK